MSLDCESVVVVQCSCSASVFSSVYFKWAEKFSAISSQSELTVLMLSMLSTPLVVSLAKGGDVSCAVRPLEVTYL